jgi:hypothetical protein
MRFALPIVLLVAVVTGYHGYYWLADIGWPIRVADRAVSGVERLLLYGAIAGLALWPLRSVAPRAAAFMLAMYGASEAAQVAVFQSWQAITDARLGVGVDVGDALLGWPVGAVSAAVWGLGFVVVLTAGLWRTTRRGEDYSVSNCYTGYARIGNSPWKILAAVFCWPFAGKVWFIYGVGYRFDRTVGGLVRDPVLYPPDYVLRRFTGDPQALRPGLPWSLKNNCVTMG